MLKAAFSLVYGTPDLLDLYEIPKGTAFRVQALLPLFFEEGCYAVSDAWMGRAESTRKGKQAFERIASSPLDALISRAAVASCPIVLESCLCVLLQSDPSDCLDEADPEYPILQSGFAPLLMAFSADAEMLSLDYEEQLTRDNHK